ncbi:spore coat protein (inner) [Desulforamulus reducens MI-1]|uniref:Spore coat protein (Inner) n=1 Tax=Desulforamulus reducens (strain ATCC BAA-1160 / DSM 100696 / MI-1) TaxID=349161 RepID=A4J4M5_DESRM|nr:CotH kinase family protein [Desulforamulus reducens]ABO50028.1 spore coat protein (inner) [Desulforamulus reducens MI-1]
MENNGRNIPSYSLFINPRDLRELRSDIWNNEHVPAQLKISNTSYQVEIAYRGALTRELPKKSYHLKFIKPETFAGGREIHLNAEYLDPSLMRNKLSFDFFKSLGTLSPEAKYVLLLLNGTFMGVFLQLESVDDLLIKKRGLPAGAIFYAHNHDANFSLLAPDTDDVKDSLMDGYKRKVGTKSDDGYLCELIYKINTVSREDFGKEIVKYVDIGKYLRWLIGVVCTQNYDGFIQNYALYRNSDNGLFEMIPWDYDGTWGRDCYGKIMEYNYIPIRGANTLTARIMDVPYFRHQYRLMFEETIETLFIPEVLEPQVTALYNVLRPHINLDPYKQKSLRKFDAEPEYILQFIKKRNKFLKDQLLELV